MSWNHTSGKNRPDHTSEKNEITSEINFFFWETLEKILLRKWHNFSPGGVLQAISKLVLSFSQKLSASSPSSLTSASLLTPSSSSFPLILFFLAGKLYFCVRYSLESVPLGIHMGAATWDFQNILLHLQVFTRAPEVLPTVWEPPSLCWTQWWRLSQCVHYSPVL